MIHSVAQYLEKSYEMFPQKEAIFDGDTVINYETFRNSSRRIATGLCRKNIKRKPVIVLMHNTYKAIISFWGVAYSNNIYVPIDEKLPVDRLKSIGDILEPAVVISCENIDEEKRTELQELFKCEVVCYDNIIETECDNELVDISIKNTLDLDPLYIVFTSGSTGVPKGVTIGHRAAMDFTEEASMVMEFSEKEKFLNQAPFYFDASVPDIYCSVYNAAELHIVPRTYYSFPKKLVDYIEEHEINSLYWVPSALVTVANLKALKPDKLKSLNKIMFCGEVMPVKQLKQWQECVPNAKNVNYYGPSEATYACSYYIIDREFEDSEMLPIGKAAINTDLIILDDEQKVVTESGVIGELCIRGTGLALGYYNNPQKTSEAFVQNPSNTAFPEIIYRTGDLSHYDVNGDICFDGRKDYQIKHMGYRIELGEIECMASGVDGVKKVACVYSEKKNGIACFYEGSIDKSELKASLKSKLPMYMVPEFIFNVRALPMNSNGKTDRIELSRRFENE